MTDHVEGLRYLARYFRATGEAAFAKKTDEHAEYFEQQSAHIAELEAERDTAIDRLEIERRYHDETRGYRQHEEQLRRSLEAERDAVRKVLVLCSQGRITIGLERVRCDDKFADHDGTPEGVEAALLAAARKGGAK